MPLQAFWRSPGCPAASTQLKFPCHPQGGGNAVPFLVAPFLQHVPQSARVTFSCHRFNHFFSSFIYWLERKKNIDLLFHLSMHSLVDFLYVPWPGIKPTALAFCSMALIQNLYQLPVACRLKAKFSHSFIHLSGGFLLNPSTLPHAPNSLTWIQNSNFISCCSRFILPLPLTLKLHVFIQFLPLSNSELKLCTSCSPY